MKKITSDHLSATSLILLAPMLMSMVVGLINHDQNELVFHLCVGLFIFLMACSFACATASDIMDMD